MSLEDIDNKFDKVAKGLVSDKKEQPHVEPEQPQDKSSYEEKTKSVAISPLLSMFENHLREQQSKKDTEASDEFRTINLSEKDIIQSPSHLKPDEGSLQENEVSEEQLDSLLNFSKPPSQTQVKKDTVIESTVYIQTRYEDVHPPPNNIASWDDLQITHPTPDNSISGPTNTPRQEDTTTGFKPVNVSEKYKKSNDEVDTLTEISDKLEQSQTIPDEVVEKIKQHKSKKQISEVDGTLANE